MIDLNTKVAVITGAAGGIGRGMARACAAHGMRVVVADLDETRLDATVSELRTNGTEVIGRQCDVRSLESVEVLRDDTLDHFGSIDLVCNNAGIGLVRPIGECTATDWSLLFDVNVGGVVNGIRTFVPYFVEAGSGHISATASLAGLVADPGLVIYSGTKFAVVGLMEGLATELARDSPGVTASVLCPGPVATDIVGNSNAELDRAEAHPDDERVAAYLARGMNPDEVGQIAIDGIAAGDFWLLSHPELTMEVATPRFESLTTRRLHLPDEWTDQ